MSTQATAPALAGAQAERAAAPASTRPRPRVAVVGAGAVGCYYGGMLARAGVPVTLIGRPAHVDAMRRDGLRLSTAAFDEHIRVEASTDVAAAGGASLVLVCVKSTDTEATGAQLAAHLAPSARVLSLQNGVDNAARLQARLQRPVWPAVVYVATEMGGPGHVRHLGRGELVIASDIGAAAPSPSQESVVAALEAVAEADGGLTSADLVALFAPAGVPVELSDNVLGALWIKLVLNCGYNALSAITQMAYGPLVTLPGMAQTVRSAVLECLAVADALGIQVPGDVFAAVDRIAATMPGQVSSTCQDLRRGKPTEIDHLNGYVATAGERLGVSVTVNRALHALVKALEMRAS